MPDLRGGQIAAKPSPSLLSDPIQPPHFRRRCRGLTVGALECARGRNSSTLPSPALSKDALSRRAFVGAGVHLPPALALGVQPASLTVPTSTIDHCVTPRYTSYGSQRARSRLFRAPDGRAQQLNLRVWADDSARINKRNIRKCLAQPPAA